MAQILLRGSHPPKVSVQFKRTLVREATMTSSVTLKEQEKSIVQGGEYL